MFAVCRSRISEGLDFNDRIGRAVVVIGLPYPPIRDAKVVLKKEYMNKVRGISENDFYNNDSFKAVNQAIGRVIRHRKDYGAIILCDGRYSDRKNYLSSTCVLLHNIIEWIRPNVEVVDKFGSVISRLKLFFENAAQKYKLDTPIVPSIDTSLLYSSDDAIVPITTPVQTAPITKRMIAPPIQTPNIVAPPLPAHRTVFKAPPLPPKSAPPLPPKSSPQSSPQAKQPSSAAPPKITITTPPAKPAKVAEATPSPKTSPSNEKPAPAPLNSSPSSKQQDAATYLQSLKSKLKADQFEHFKKLLMNIKNQQNKDSDKNFEQLAKDILDLFNELDKDTCLGFAVFLPAKYQPMFRDLTSAKYASSTTANNKKRMLLN